MKKIISAIVFLMLSCGMAFSQNKGDMYFGGFTGVSFLSTSYDGFSESATAFAIQTEFGYFVGNNCKLGFGIGYGISDGVHTFTACPNFAYYVRLCDGLFYVPSVDVGFVMGLNEGISMPGCGVALHTLSLEFRPSKHFGFITNLLSFEAVVLNDNEYDVTSSAISCNIGMNPTIGLKYYF